VGQLGKLIDAFSRRGISRCVMAGQIAPKNLFDLRPDLKAVALLFRLKERNARTIFSAIADELQKEGIHLVEATPWLRSLMPEAGFVAGPKPSRAQQEDAEFGRRIAEKTSSLQIGQTVVVKKGTILAVEAFEGTDACLRRGGELAGKSGGAIAVKVAGAHHDFRFDIPCIGPQTLETCRAGQLSVLAFEGGKTLLIEREEVERLAARYGISLLALA
jgi:DUF1009 family protein